MNGYRNMHGLADDSNFDPEDMSELEGIFASMIEDNESGYFMEFIISKLAAKELVSEWIKACNGDAKALNISLHEYAKIIAEINSALED